MMLASSFSIFYNFSMLPAWPLFLKVSYSEVLSNVQDYNSKYR